MHGNGAGGTVSLQKILALVADGRLHLDQATREHEQPVIAGLVKDGQVFLLQAHQLAMATRPRVTHPELGEGWVVGVTLGGALEVEVGSLGCTIAVAPSEMQL